MASRPMRRYALGSAVLVFLILFGFQLPAEADIIHLKNGRSVEGIINKEDDGDVNLEIGFGTMKFPKEQIASIQRSSPEDAQLIRQRWIKEKESSEARAREIQQRREHEPKQVTMDKQSGQMIVETTLNKKVKARLALDTGASVVVLSSKIAASLGIDVSIPASKADDVVEFVLADGRKVEARRVILDNVSVQGSEIEKVEAAILFEQEDSVLANDGLLGMSFLGNFSFKIDQKNSKLVLEKL